MSSVNYPSKETLETFDIINSASLKIKVVKLKTIRENRNLIHSFLTSVCKEYQDKREQDHKNSIARVFSNQLSEYIKSDSDEHPNIIYNRFKKVSLDSKLKDKFSINLINSNKSIFHAVIVKKDYDQDYVDLNLAYSLFSKKTMTEFLPTSKYFNIIDEKMIVDMLDQRFVVKNYEEKIKNMRKEIDEDEILEKEIAKLKEIVEYNSSQSHSLDPVNFLELLKDINSKEEIILELLSCVFELNIFICRNWSHDISIIKEIHHSSKSHSIIFFKYSGKISLTGIKSETFYECGGIKIEDKIWTILNYKTHKSIIKKLRENLESGSEKFLMDNYHSYLNNFDNTEHIDKMETNYDSNIDKLNSDSNIYSDETSDNFSSKDEKPKNTKFSKDTRFLKKMESLEKSILKGSDRDFEDKIDSFKRSIQSITTDPDLSEKDDHTRHTNISSDKIEKKMDSVENSLFKGSDRDFDKKINSFKKTIRNIVEDNTGGLTETGGTDVSYQDENSVSYQDENSVSYQDENNIPYFIKGFSDEELKDLYHKFINSEADVDSMSRINLEIQYKNYIEREPEDVFTIIQNLKEKTV